MQKCFSTAHKKPLHGFCGAGAWLNQFLFFLYAVTPKPSRAARAITTIGTIGMSSLVCGMADVSAALAALAVCGVLSVLLSPADWLPHIIGALCVSVPMFLLCLVIDGAFGGGDIKLMAAAGLFLGWQNTLLAMFFGIVFGGIYGIYLLAAKKAGKKDHFAFGPFLCAGIVIAMLFGGPVLEWYCAFL